ncbi:MAG: type II secretion system minor pseudopilin GspK [Thermodesulfobacteriota bacterium]
MRRRRDGERGVALLVTLLVLVLVVALANEIFRLGARAAQTSAYGRDSIRCALLAEAGTAAAVIALREDAKDSQIDTLDEFWSRAVPPIELGDGAVRITVEDEERKINLNQLVSSSGTNPHDRWFPVFQRFLSGMGIDPSLAEAFVDWLDNDDAPRAGGAETVYYMSLPNPYEAKNDLFDSVEEILLVRGVTREIYDKIRPFVTVSTSTSAGTSTGTGKVNINTAPVEVLTALSAGMDAAIDNAAAAQLIAYRTEKPFEKTSDIKNVSTFFSDLYTRNRTRMEELITVSSSTFHVRSAGEVGSTVRTIDAIGRRSGNDVKWRSWRLE